MSEDLITKTPWSTDEAPAEEPVHFGQRVPYGPEGSETAFKGDPSRVLGHPSNPSTLSAEALEQPAPMPAAEALQLGHVALPEVQQPGFIAEVPADILNPHN